MNKKIILPFVAILVLAVAMVGAASADEVTTVDTVEVRGEVKNGTEAYLGIIWTAQNFSAFWYDLDDDQSTETLTLASGDVNGTDDRTIGENNLTYRTATEAQEYELYEAGMQLNGADNDTHYFIEGWMAEKYVAVNDNADKLVKLLVEFEGDDKKTLSTGESWDLGSGFALTAQQIDLEGAKVWLKLEKDGKELDSEVITGGTSDNDSVYTYTADIANEEDVPVFSCLIGAVFRGTESNIVQVEYVFLTDNEVLEIDTSDTYGVMEVTKASSTEIELKNKDNTIDLSKDTTEHIMGNMYFKTADDNTLRFYPMVEYTEPGTYEVRGSVKYAADAVNNIVWNAHNFAAFWYDLDDDQSTETLTLTGGKVDNTDRTIDEDELVYRTATEAQEYELYEAGMQLNGADNDTHYFIEGWMAEKYVAVNDNADKLVKLLVEFEGDDKKTLSTGESWDLGSGFALTAQQIDLEGAKVWLKLEKDGKELDSEVITGGTSDNDSVYTYTTDLANEEDVPVFSCLIGAVFRGTESNIVQVEYVFLTDNEVLEIDTSETYGVMEVTKASSTEIELKNKDNTIDLSKDTTEHIMGNMYFKTADDDTLRFYPMVEYTIGEGAAGEADDEDEVETPTDANVTADVNVTPTAVVTPTTEPSPTAPEDDTAADDADAAEDAEPTPTEKKTPGFEAIFAIAGLLAVAYLVLRQRE